MERKKIMFLPHELIIQILLRLPVKSLIGFKCVCKSWFSLISHDSHFANSHFQLTSSTHNRKILFISPSPHEARSIDFKASLDDDSASTSLNINFMHLHSNFLIEFKSSCRGFIFLHCFSINYLWNPSTGLHRKIPLSPIESNLDATCLCYLYGFGYDSLRDDYLLVSMSYDPNADHISSRLEFFSLRANIWKEIEAVYFPYINASHNPIAGSLFNEAIHWLAKALRRDLSINVIVSFDLTERKLFEMPLPDDFDHDPTYSDLWVFGEFLSLWAIGEDTVEIWVMKEYKVHSSWTKTLVLPLDDIPTEYFSPLCYTNRGDIIGTDGGTGLVKYDDKGQMIEHCCYCNDPRGSHVVMYTESLLLFPDDNEQA